MTTTDTTKTDTVNQSISSESLHDKNQKEEQGFSQAYVYVWTSNPTRERVRVILDDGLIKMSLHREKFLNLLANVIDIDKPGTNYNYFKIKESVYRYGGWYFYDKVNDDFRELGEKVNFEVIRPIELLSESRKSLVHENLHQQFSNLNRINEDFKRYRTSQPKSISERFGSFFQVIRNFQKPKR